MPVLEVRGGIALGDISGLEIPDIFSIAFGESDSMCKADGGNASGLKERTGSAVGIMRVKFLGVIECDSSKGKREEEGGEGSFSDG